MKKKIILFFCLAFFIISCNKESFFVVGQGHGKNVVEYSDIKIYVVSSTGGAPLEGAEIVIYDKAGKEVERASSDSKGLYLPKLDKGTYTICASKEGYSLSKFINIDIPSLRENIELYCRKETVSNSVKEVPQIDEIGYSSDGTNFKPLEDTIIRAKEFKYLKISAISKNGIAVSDKTSVGIGLQLDNKFSGFNLIVPSSYVDELKAEGDFFRTTAIFDFSEDIFPSNRHYFDVAIYDLAGNKTEQFVNFTIKKDNSKKDFNIKNDIVNISYIKGRSFNVDRDVMGFSSDKTEYIVLQLQTKDLKGDNSRIRGYYIYRSEDNKNYKFIDKVSFNGLYQLEFYEYVDDDPSLEIGKRYYYKVSAFNNSYVTKLSRYSFVEILESHSIVLHSPQNNYETDNLSVGFKFKINSDIASLITDCDEYIFIFKIKSVPQGDLFFSYFVKYDIKNNKFYNLSTEKEISEGFSFINNNTFSIELSSLNKKLLPGKTYMWSVYGYPHGSSFVKYFYNSGGEEIGNSSSFSSSIEYGGFAENSSFALTTSVEAE